MSEMAFKLGDGYGDYGDPMGVKDPSAVIPNGYSDSSYVNAFSPDGSHTSLDQNFERTQLANVQKSDPNYSVATGYSLPAVEPSPWPKVIGLGLVGFGIYWFLLRKKV